MYKAIILAAGKGTRMNSDLPKVLNEINGKTFIQCIIDEVKKTSVDEIIIVVGYKGEQVIESIKDKVTFVEQKEQLGTGHAVIQAIPHINDDDTILVLNGDHPLIKADTINNFTKQHKDNNNAASILTNIIDDPGSYGRILRDDKGNVIGIIEKRDANEEQLKIKEYNTGEYCFNGKELKAALKMISNNNNQKEYYLTDTIKIMMEANLNVGGYVTDDYRAGLGVNTQEDFRIAEEELKKCNE